MALRLKDLACQSPPHPLPAWQGPEQSQFPPKSELVQNLASYVSIYHIKEAGSQ